MASRDEVSDVLAVIAAAYFMITVPKETIRLYVKELEDVPADDLLGAAQDHIKCSRFFPTIAELRTGYDGWLVSNRKLLSGREWKTRLEEWKQEALPEGEGVKSPDACSDMPLSWAVLAPDRSADEAK